MFRPLMWSIVAGSAVVMLVAMSSPVARAQRPDAAGHAAKPAGPADDKVARGRYVVEDVALCTRCHTPVDANGVRDRARWLMGGQVGIHPTVAVPSGDWAMVAPRLAGRPAGTDEDFVRLMTTGISRRGTSLRQPMLQFRMSQADAEAVLAYLKSLGADTPTGTR